MLRALLPVDRGRLSRTHRGRQMIAPSGSAGPDFAVAALIVCADPHTTELLEFTLSAHDIDSRATDDVDDALHIVRTHSVKLVVLDLDPTPENNLKFARHIRDQGDVPILMMSRTDSRADIITALEHGADDCITNPFHPRELGLRAQSLTRRYRSDATSALQHIGQLSIDLTRLTATIAGQPLDLTFIEFRLLAHLATNRGIPQTWQTLLHTVWEAHTLTGGRDIVKSAIYRLRTRLAVHDTADYIRTLRGIGYLMVDLPPRSASVPDSRRRQGGE
jgi:DNA-binding response OmpR family regulator